MSQTITIAQRVLEAEVMQRYARGEIGLNKVAELLGIHIMDAQALLKQYDLELQLTVEDVQQELDELRDVRHH